MKKQLLACATVLGLSMAPFVASSGSPAQPTAAAGWIIADYSGENPWVGAYCGAYVGYMIARFIPANPVPFMLAGAL